MFLFSKPTSMVAPEDALPGRDEAMPVKRVTGVSDSDLAVHDMGPGLADEVTQGGAEGGEFRTAPLWGLGKRIFFLHDGRTTNLITAINAHKSAANAQFEASEANKVVDNFNALPDASKQDLLNFLRSL